MTGSCRYRMLAIDLDGTLFDSTGKVPAENIAAVARAKEAGMLVVLCTGRGLTESRSAIEALQHDGPVVLSCGAHVADPLTGGTRFRSIVEPHLAGELIEHLNPDRHAVIMLVDPDVLGHDYLVVGENRLTSNTRWWFEMIGARVRSVAQPSFEDLHHILRVGLVGPSSVMPPIELSLTESFGPRISVQHFTAVRLEDAEDIHVLEVFAGGVNKWSGLQWVAAEHGIAESEIAAIGDEINDVHMLRHAACGIAMGNASEPAKRAARYTTESNNEAGVAKAIDRMLSGRW